MPDKNVKLGKYMTAYPVSSGKRDPYMLEDSSGRSIGMVEYYSRWRQFIFNAESDAVFSSDCLVELARFCQRLTDGAKHSTRLTDEPVNNGSCGCGDLAAKRDQS